MKPLTVKLTDDDLLLLKTNASAAGLTLGAYARQLLTKALGCADAANPTAVAQQSTSADLAQIECIVRRGVWAAIVALSPDLDEQTAMAFVRAYMGRDANKLGYDESAEV